MSTSHTDCEEEFRTSMLKKMRRRERGAWLMVVYSKMAQSN